jgi:hypothetical protein
VLEHVEHGLVVLDRPLDRLQLDRVGQRLGDVIGVKREQRQSRLRRIVRQCRQPCAPAALAGGGYGSGAPVSICARSGPGSPVG